MINPKATAKSNQATGEPSNVTAGENQEKKEIYISQTHVSELEVLMRSKGETHKDVGVSGEGVE